MPTQLEWIRDFRKSESDRLIAISHEGVYSVEDSTLAASLLVAGGQARNELFHPYSLGVSRNRIVVGAIAFSYSEVDTKGQQLKGLYAFADPEDLDIRGDDLAILGAQQGEKGPYAPDGALVHRGKIGDSGEQLKPIFFSEEGPGVPGLSNCSLMEIQSLRFLADGTLVVVPGIEGGVYFFDPEGKLIRSFTAAEVGFDSGCKMDPKVADRLALDQQGRWDWVNGRRVVDDIVPLPDGGAGLILREIRGGKPFWQMKVLHKDGSIRSCDLAITTNDPWARLKADTLGDEVSFLMSRRGYQRYRGWRTNNKTGERVEFPIKLHPDEPALFIKARYLP